VTARHADALAELLADIALTPGTSDPTPEAWWLVGHHHPSHESMTTAWQAFRREVADREAMATGERDWTDPTRRRPGWMTPSSGRPHGSTAHTGSSHGGGRGAGVTA
jgi:hypothetical protein